MKRKDQWRWKEGVKRKQLIGRSPLGALGVFEGVRRKKIERRRRKKRREIMIMRKKRVWWKIMI